MTRHHTLAELVLGIEGLALLRGLIAGTDDEAAARVGDIRRVIADGDERLSTPIAHPERSVRDGYAAWSATYDAPGNALIQLEETVLLALLAKLPAGHALDAACGTGRVSSLLAARGHEVLGVDTSPEMLARARDKVPEARFVDGGLEALPVDDGAFDLAVCCLALDHCADLAPPIAEFARAVRRGGRVILTDIHPAMVHLGGQAAYVDADGARAFVRAHPHLHSDYLSAFRAARLEVDELIEPPPNRAWFELQKGAWSSAPDAFVRAFDGIPAAIVWSLVRR